MFKKILFGVVLVIIFLSIIIFISGRKKFETAFGASYNPLYARYLGVDAQKTYEDLFAIYGFKYVRLSAQWDWMEEKNGRIDYTDLDWMMDEAARNGAKIMLAVGQKTPRWPECHVPDWAKDLSEEEYQAVLHNFVAQVVERYKNHPALEIWQVENEPFLLFGEKCHAFSKEDLQAEIALVKKIDPQHKILTSDSGELSTWFKTARAADLFGTTLYRVVWDKNFGYLHYDLIPTVFYRIKLWLNCRSVEQAFVSELQAEPWIPNMDLKTADLAEQYKSMSLDQLEKNVNFTKKLGWPRAYLWGAEWWAWLENKQQLEIPNYIKSLNKK